MEKIINMHYSQYKKHYSDCETVKGSYNKEFRTVDVIIPDGRLKKSGVRGNHFHGYELFLIDGNGKEKYCCYRATCMENAIKQHLKLCKENGWVPAYENGEVKSGHIY